MESIFNLTKETLENSSKILLTTHERTDGDDLGTVLAIYAHLSIFKNKDIRIVIKGGVPEQLKYLPNSDKVTEKLDPSFIPDVILYSGCSKKDRCNLTEITSLIAPVINFDHHPDNTNFGDINVVDSKKSSVAELTYDFFNNSNWKITSETATCLLTGIFTDTGSFMHSNTKQASLLAAADLMKKGASLTKIAKYTYKGKSPNTLKAWGKALENTYYDANRKIIYSVMTTKDLTDLKDLPLSSFEGFVETLNKVPEAKVAMFLKQDGDTIKGSLRSDPHKGIDVQKIAKILGGGGHVWASGFSIVGQLQKNELGKWVVTPTMPEVTENITSVKNYLKEEASLPFPKKQA